MNGLDQKARWQHIVLFLAAGVLLSGAALLSIHLGGKATAKTPRPWVGVAFVAGALIAASLAWQSLRQANRREEIERLLAAGLFALPPHRGDALVRLNAELATHFGLSRAPARAPWPETFEALVDAVYGGIADARVTPLQYLTVRQALAEALGRSPQDIRYRDRLEALIPAGRQRFTVWERLRTFLPALPAVELNPWVENIAIYAIIALLIAIAVPIAQSLDRNEATKIENPTIGQRLVGKAFGLVLFGVVGAVLMVPVYLIGRKYACRVPKQFDTVASMASFASPPGPQPAWTRAEVEDHVREFVAAALQRAPREILPATQL